VEAFVLGRLLGE
jgi:hypothetical protein